MLAFHDLDQGDLRFFLFAAMTLFVRQMHVSLAVDKRRREIQVVPHRHFDLLS